jgi:hypothetical protein
LRGDIIGQVGDDPGAFTAELGAGIEGLRVGVHDIEPAGIALGDRIERRQRAFVALDRNHPPGTQRQQCACQPAGPGADLNDRSAFERPRSARDPRRQIEVEQEILTERFAC